MICFFLILLTFPFSITTLYNETLALEYWYYNLASFTKPIRLSVWYVPFIHRIYPNVWDIHIYENEKAKTLGYSAYNSDTNTILLVFRGSVSAKNWFENLKFLKKKFNALNCRKCKVHTGFRNAYNSFPKDLIIFDLQNLKRKYRKAKIVISGFSLGGAIANLFLFDVCNEIGKVDIFMTFGAPRVGNSRFSDSMRNLQCGGVEKFRVVNGKDPVPHHPFKWLSYAHGQSEVFYEGENFYICDDPESKLCSNKHNALKARKSKHHSEYFHNLQLQKYGYVYDIHKASG